MTEVLIEHRGLDERTARQRSLELLDLVGIPAARPAGSTSTRTSSRAACASG